MIEDADEPAENKPDIVEGIEWEEKQCFLVSHLPELCFQSCIDSKFVRFNIKRSDSKKLPPFQNRYQMEQAPLAVSPDQSTSKE